MAIGDAGAAKGLAIYPSTQDRKLGYQNDNQRADDVAATMTRLVTLEARMSFDAGNVQKDTSSTGTVNVAHNLGKKPSAEQITPSNNGTIPLATRFIVSATSATTFTVIAVRDDNGADPRPLTSNAVGFHWAVFG